MTSLMVTGVTDISQPVEQLAGVMPQYLITLTCVTSITPPLL
jgi:hypothetical protein